MSVWFSIVASMALMFKTVYADELGNIGTMIFGLVFVVTLFGGTLYDSSRTDKLKKLEEEVERLKESNKEI